MQLSLHSHYFSLDVHFTYYSTGFLCRNRLQLVTFFLFRCNLIVFYQLLYFILNGDVFLRHEVCNLGALHENFGAVLDSDVFLFDKKLELRALCPETLHLISCFGGSSVAIWIIFAWHHFGRWLCVINYSDLSYLELWVLIIVHRRIICILKLSCL